LAAEVRRHIEWLAPLKLNKDELLVFSACDSKYFEYAFTLVKSMEAFSPGFSFALHLINPTEEVCRRALDLHATLRHTRLAISREETNLAGLDADATRTYYACARFNQVKEILDQYSEAPVFSLDADSLIINPIDLNFSDKIDAEIVILQRNLKEDVPEHLSVAAGAIWFKPTEGVIHFLTRVSEEIDRRLANRELKWFDDQVIFGREMKASRRKIRFYNLKKKYADWEFSTSSIVWAGKGPRKESDMRFFLLQSMLSCNSKHRQLADALWSSLDAANGSLASDAIYPQKIACIRSQARRVSLYIPRLDLPWKRDSDSKNRPPLIPEDVLNLRLHWTEFAARLANALEREGIAVDVIELPAAEIDRDRVEASGSAHAFIPHRCRRDFADGRTPVTFYMQEFFRWVFIVDKAGWSAASSVYPLMLDNLPNSESDTLDVYRHRLFSGELGSKFGQTSEKSRAQLISEGSIPTKRTRSGLREARPFIFFPLQIPHDQSIKYFSPLEEADLLNKLVAWADSHSVAMVMKPHPANRKAMEPFRRHVNNQNIFWSEANVHDLIANATGVFTINSGVGFEALLHTKPVVTFGHVEYDCVSFRASHDNLDAAWSYCCDADATLLEGRYRRFINWFLDRHAVDMSRTAQATERLAEIAADLRSRLDTLESRSSLQ